MLIAMTFLAGCFVGILLIVLWTMKKSKPDFEKHAALAILCARIRGGDYPSPFNGGYLVRDAHRESDHFMAAGIAHMHDGKEAPDA